jgi:hypothetical protein
MYKTTYTVFLFLALCGVNFTASANQELKVPLPLETAAIAYEKQGVEAFIPALYGAPLTSRSNIDLHNGTSVLQKVEALYGNYTGVEIIKDIQLSKSIQTVFFIMKYQRGPLYGVLTTYRQDDDKDTIMEFKINIERAEILPTNLIF